LLYVNFIPGTENLQKGVEVKLWLSYVAGCILLGIAPRKARVIM
jgi:ACR3 family arsenite efflux pump ArsB